MQKHEVDKLLHCLDSSKELIHDPMLVPIFLLELRVNFFAMLLEKRALGIEEIEYSTGMRHGFSSDPRRNPLIDLERKDKAKTLDFDPITQKLTGLTGTLSYCDMTFSSARKALDIVKQFRSDVRRSCQENRHGMPEAKALNRRVDYLDNLITGSQAYASVMSARTKAQVQTVYSMIGQRDNRLNIETAAASREIAALSLVHNENMKDIAEDSRNVAILTRRDSLDMRIIAAVTLIFLPGTFLATMFGSGFFRFFPEGSNKRISGWIWLYWVLTGAITGIVLLGWWAFMKFYPSHLTQIKKQIEVRGVAKDTQLRAMSILEESNTIRHTSFPLSPTPTRTPNTRLSSFGVDDYSYGNKTARARLGSIASVDSSRAREQSLNS
jgi:Mg2+ and Co2+ transporter CorA